MKHPLTLATAALAIGLSGCSSGRTYEQGIATQSLPPRPQAPMVREPARPYGHGYGLGNGPQAGSYRWNGNPNRVQEGTLPPNLTPPATPITGADGRRTIVVRPGDTLYSLARHHGISVAALADENGLMTASISAGQRLVLPPAAR